MVSSLLDPLEEPDILSGRPDLIGVLLILRPQPDIDAVRKLQGQHRAPVARADDDRLLGNSAA